MNIKDIEKEFNPRTRLFCSCGKCSVDDLRTKRNFLVCLFPLMFFSFPRCFDTCDKWMFSLLPSSFYSILTIVLANLIFDLSVEETTNLFLGSWFLNVITSLVLLLFNVKLNKND